MLHIVKKKGDEEIQEQGYFAVIAFDGDGIGKWISGENTPKIQDQLARYKDEKEKGLEAYLKKLQKDQGDTEATVDTFLKTQRPVSPSYHLQLSEALSNFALKCVKPVVDNYQGQLIYAGGDDVLALVAATDAVNCAQDLARVFRGINPELKGPIIKSDIKLNALRTDDDKLLLHGDNPKTIHGYLCRTKDKAKEVFVLPGLRATASAGIAIAHSKSPLQDAVKAAQKAEKDAKHIYGKNAIAVQIVKRSGEISEWGVKLFQKGEKQDEPSSEISHGMAALELILQELPKPKEDKASEPESTYLSAKFPYRLQEVLDPLVNARGMSDYNEDDVSFLKLYLQRELENNLFQNQLGTKAKNGDKGFEEFKGNLTCHLEAYLDEIKASYEKERKEKGNQSTALSLRQIQLTRLIGLLSTAAWIVTKDSSKD